VTNHQYSHSLTVALAPPRSVKRQA